MSPRRKRSKPVKVAYFKQKFALDETPPPPSAERQAEVERILHLKPGTLDPKRQAIRSDLRDRALVEELRQELANPTPQELDTMECFKKIIDRGFKFERRGGPERE
jgi:hypothetical protein